MILTVDIGNTTVNLCGAERDSNQQYSIVFSEKTDTVRGKDSRFYLEKMREKLKKNEISPDMFEGAVLASVVPELIAPVGEAVRKLTEKEPLIISADIDLGFTSDVKNIQKVGLDRLADAAWAAENYPLPAVTVDTGTATTFNVIDDKRVFRGGVIAAGIETSLNALSAKAAQLPDIKLSAPCQIIGRDTEECMLSGALAGTAAMIDGIVFAIEKELGKEVTLIITGGLSAFVEPLCRHSHIYVPDLLPKGLALLYDKNR